MQIEQFNTRPAAELAAALQSCVAIDSWVETLLAGRPYRDAEHLLTNAQAETRTWTSTDIEAALAHHARIGERPSGEHAGATHSRREQAGVDLADAELAERLREGNRRYEERFGRIYLVRAEGRSGSELAALLERRLQNDDAAELEVTKQQLAEIALLRLADLIDRPEETA